MPGWAPTVAQVSAVVPTRAGTDTGVFDATTLPTANQVTSLIMQICDEVVGDVGGFDSAAVITPEAEPDPVTLGDLARWAATLGTAAFIERGFFPEQQENTVGDVLYQRYTEAIARLRTAIAFVRDRSTFSPGEVGSVTIVSAGVRAYLNQGGVLPAINGPDCCP